MEDIEGSDGQGRKKGHRVLKVCPDLMSWMILFDSKFDSMFRFGNWRVKNDGTWRMLRFLIRDLVDRVILDVRD